MLRIIVELPSIVRMDDVCTSRPARPVPPRKWLSVVARNDASLGQTRRWRLSLSGNSWNMSKVVRSRTLINEPNGPIVRDSPRWAVWPK